MPEYSRIALASHGTPGGQAAERVALSLCARGALLSQLVVVPDFWKGMMGATGQQRVHRNHGKRRAPAEAEIAVQVQRVRAQAAQAQLLQCRTVLGKPAECLLAHCRELAPELVVIGAPRPRGAAGLRSRMRLETLVAALEAPLLIVPHP
jgi:nucleotide-binding universal stress UspA family protein